ncbi:MAG: YbaK/EbsC family protein [Acidobacteria bacterium]|nr:YbaK/EbsC family protein [Acidobacteriota bacterium]
MIAQRIKSFLDENEVKYETLFHTLTYTAQTTAESAHIPGLEMAKTVVINVDGRLAMAVLPASRHVSLPNLREVTGSSDIHLAGESELRTLFPGCELGAMPPFGNLYGLDVWVDPLLARHERIAFNAGSHTELIRMRYADFERLVCPMVATFAMA